MPSGKRARQERNVAPPPPVGSKGGAGASIKSRRTLLIALGVLALVGIGVGLGVGLSGGGGGGNTANLAPLSSLGKLISPGLPGPAGPETPPIESGSALAPADSPALGASVDGIQCGAGEQAAFHIHARLTIFVDGKSRSVPAGVGIADPQISPTAQGPFVTNGSCFSWLHTHAADGIVHIESPVQRVYTLGNFFDIWKQPLSRTQAGPARGPVTVLYNGKVWTGNPRDVPLHAHAQIQLEVGKPLVAPENITNWGGL
jgi:hypothetical protein